jgi:Phosphotransferase enzyme family
MTSDDGEARGVDAKARGGQAEARGGDVETLRGGVANQGAVVRIGSTVHRPVGVQTAAVHAFLRHLETQGFDGAPRVLGFDADGREVLTFVPGEVAIPPELPAWVTSDDLLVSVAELQHAIHRAAAGFVPPPRAAWNPGSLPDTRPEVVCHADICVENVVVRDARAVAFIDFDWAAPMDRRMDIAIALRHWIPMRDPADLEPSRQGVDQRGRFAAFCDVHGLAADDRAYVLDLLGAYLDLALVSMERRAAAGHPGFGKIWNAGYAASNRRARRWLETSRGGLLA